MRMNEARQVAQQAGVVVRKDVADQPGHARIEDLFLGRGRRLVHLDERAPRLCVYGHAHDGYWA